MNQEINKLDQSAEMSNKAMEDPFNDDRFCQLNSMAKELKGLNEELNHMICNKCDALLGIFPQNSDAASVKAPHPMGWLEETMDELAKGISACQASIARMSSL